MHIQGYISDYDGQTLTIYAPFDNDYILQKQKITEVALSIKNISLDKRVFVYQK